LAALAARCLEHLATAAGSASAATAGVATAPAARAALRLPRRSAFRTTIGFILEALASKKLLFA
jgi:predicted 2-oxoglutarate/Fe(II)-dependent dioxygenase YbiX